MGLLRQNTDAMPYFPPKADLPQPHPQPHPQPQPLPHPQPPPDLHRVATAGVATARAKAAAVNTSTVDTARVASKLSPPSVTAVQVPRAAVCQRIAQAGAVKLVLVRAPAGFGKTTAMVQVRTPLAAQGIDTAWLTLERTDNDVPRFLACLRQALAPIIGDPPAGDAPLALVDALAAQPSPFTLFLDDFELITEPAVLGLVREIIDHLPRRGQLVLGSRSLPDLGLGRLRAAGQLLEIDVEHLRFSRSETEAFFALRHAGADQRPLGADRSHLDDLHRKTEGWIAALWLASVSLERREGRSEFISRFSGSNQAIADYLAEDVLAHQPPPVRDFLLRTSILRHLNESLCSALLPDSDSGAILRQPEASNLFLTPIEGEERTYRYHSLFAGFLRTQLTQEMPSEMVRLHRAASLWYEKRGRPVPAIDHALEGGNYEHAVGMLSQHGESLLEGGRMRLLARWFAAIPEPYTRGAALLHVIHIWAICLSRGPWEAMALLEQPGFSATEDPKVLAHVLALRPMILAMMG
ncbi:MAG: hypothetical protein H7242_17570, partial [Microbacteriaceae bacterium]|nr:hypothetical protein [Burkholderiaceae bacterium]